MITADLSIAKELLLKGELVAIPTETVYGLAGNAFDASVVYKIFEAKQRPEFDPLIVHTNDFKRIAEFVAEFPPLAIRLAEKFWPGPLTLVLPRKEIIPDLVTSGLPTVGVRIPNHPLTLSLLKALPFPLAAPSANPFGYISPTTALHVEEQLGEKIGGILDGGPCKVGIESTIVGFENGKAVIYRLGGISKEEIVSIIGEVEIKISGSDPLAPGMLDKHYSPDTNLLVGDVDSIHQNHQGKKTGIINFSSIRKDLQAEIQVVLAPTGKLEEAATNLYKLLRELDKMKLELIIAEEVPSYGLGPAINDRLGRAASKLKH